MGKKDEKKGNGAATIQETPAEEQRQRAPEAEHAAEESQPGAPVGETTATEAPTEEPGQEDFERHSGARLVEDHAKDLALQEEIKKRIAKREEVIAARVRAKGINATVFIAGQEYTARQKSNGGGKLGLAKVNPRVPTSIDI